MIFNICGESEIDRQNSVLVFPDPYFVSDDSNNITALERALSSASKKEELETETEEGDENESDN